MSDPCSRECESFLIRTEVSHHAGFLLSQGLILQKVDVDRLVDESFAQEAVKRLGRYQ